MRGYNEKKAISLIRDLRAACFTGGFKLTKWISNNYFVLASIPDKEKAKEVKELDLDRNNLPVEQALGVQWNVEPDKFSFMTVTKQQPLTKTYQRAASLQTYHHSHVWEQILNL